MPTHLVRAYTGITVNTTLDRSYRTVGGDCSGGSITVTLPTSVGISGHEFAIKKTDSSANTLTVDANSTETIDGEVTQIISAQNVSMTIISDKVII